MFAENAHASNLEYCVNKRDNRSESCSCQTSVLRKIATYRKLQVEKLSGKTKLVHCQTPVWRSTV